MMRIIALIFTSPQTPSPLTFILFSFYAIVYAQASIAWEALEQTWFWQVLRVVSLPHLHEIVFFIIIT